jgi:hypothetical protein
MHGGSCLQPQPLRRWKQRDGEFESCLGRANETLFPKQNISKITVYMAYVVHHLCSMLRVNAPVLRERREREREREREKDHIENK